MVANMTSAAATSLPSSSTPTRIMRRPSSFISSPHWYDCIRWPVWAWETNASHCARSVISHTSIHHYSFLNELFWVADLFGFANQDILSLDFDLIGNGIFARGALHHFAGAN